MISIASIGKLLPNVTIYGYAKDRSRLDARFGSRFPAMFSRLDARFCCDEVDSSVDSRSYDLVAAYQRLRERHLLYGSGFLLAGSSDPYLGLDVADARVFVELYLEHNLEIWVCDAGFNWCVEMRSDGLARFFRSPYQTILMLLNGRN